MKEHPDYKYRPRRKPKPMNHNGSSSKKEAAKYSFPLPVPFMPPGFDPCSFSAMARSIFAQTAAPTYPHLHQESNATPAGLFGNHNSVQHSVLTSQYLYRILKTAKLFL